MLNYGIQIIELESNSRISFDVTANQDLKMYKKNVKEIELCAVLTPNSES